MDGNDKTRAYEVGPTTAGGSSLVDRVLNGAYRIEAKLGEGGMGVVYQATQIALGRTVAVKTVLAGPHMHETAVQRFFREAKLLSQLAHPNIVQIIDFGSAEPGPVHFMVMEYLRGEPLDTYVATRSPLPLKTVLDLMAQICAAVDAAHQREVIHRDLKPSNIFLVNVSGTSVPLVKVLDFGLAKAAAPGRVSSLTQTGVMMGTLGYSAPEQVGGGEPDPRADIYSLGAILYFLITGKPPYGGETFQSVLRKQMTEPPPRLEVTNLEPARARAVEAVIHKAMSLDPAQRYGTPAELMEDFEAAGLQEDTRRDRQGPTWVTTRSQVRPPVQPATPRARALRTAALGLGALLVLGGGVWLWSHKARSVGEPEPSGPPVPGVTPTEINFGMTGPFSGQSKELGRGVQTGIETCFREVNDKGGVHGRRLNLIALDDGYEPARADANAHRLLDERPTFAFVGNVGTPTGLVTLPIAEKAGHVFFGAYTGAAFLRNDPPDRLVFNFRASYAEETAAIVKYLVEIRRIPADKIAVFAQNDRYGDAGIDGVRKALRKYGQDPEHTLRVRYERNTVAINDAVKGILAKRGDVRAVVMVATYGPAAQFIKELKDQKLDAVFTNVSFVGSNPLAEKLRELGPNYAEGVIVTQVVPHYDSKATAVIRYRDALAKYQPEESPGFVSLEGYLAAELLVAALERAGRNLTTDHLVDALESIRDLDMGIGAPVSFSPSEHQASHKVWGTVLDAQGRYQPLELE